MIKIWLDCIAPDLVRDFYDVLNLKVGKIGGIFLRGPANVGKSLLVKLFTCEYRLDDIGLVVRGDGNRFWMMDVSNKKIVVAEEYITNDIDADHLKLHLEGSEFASYEIKNGERIKIEKRQPWIITSNFQLTVMCPRQYLSLTQRLYKYDMYEHELISEIAEQFYLIQREERYKLLNELYKLYNINNIKVRKPKKVIVIPE